MDGVFKDKPQVLLDLSAYSDTLVPKDRYFSTNAIFQQAVYTPEQLIYTCRN